MLRPLQYFRQSPCSPGPILAVFQAKKETPANFSNRCWFFFTLSHPIHNCCKKKKMEKKSLVGYRQNVPLRQSSLSGCVFPRQPHHFRSLLSTSYAILCQNWAIHNTTTGPERWLMERVEYVPGPGRKHWKQHSRACLLTLGILVSHYYYAMVLWYIVINIMKQICCQKNNIVIVRFCHRDTLHFNVWLALERVFLVQATKWLG